MSSGPSFPAHLQMSLRTQRSQLDRYQVIKWPSSVIISLMDVRQKGPATVQVGFVIYSHGLSPKEGIKENGDL